MYSDLVRERHQRLQASAASVRLAREVSAVEVRPVEADDHGRVGRLFARCSPHAIYLRFFSPIVQLSDDQLARLVHVDHECRDALVALRGEEIIGMASYDSRPDARVAEISVTVEDAWQRHGVGTRLVRRLMTLGADRGYDAFVAHIVPDNRAALGFVRNIAPSASISCDRDGCEARIPLLPSIC
jgi:ribosomal protein S18 acetylase RimI-like enzyme